MIFSKWFPKHGFKSLLFFAAGLILGGGSVFLAVFFYGRAELIREEPCTLPYELAVKLLPERASALGWSVRSVPCGLPPAVPGKRISVFEICSRQYATAILSPEESRKTACILPCKVAIYERDSRVWISRLNGELVSRLLGGQFRWIFRRNILPEQSIMFSDLLCGKRSSR